MKFTALTSIALAMFASTAFAQETSEGKELAELAFTQMDADQNGVLSVGEFVEQGHNIFVSMDADDSGDLVESEYNSWDYGLDIVADNADKAQAYSSARKSIFDQMDTNNDWRITSGEFDLFSAIDFVDCDVDRNGELTKEEYLLNSAVNIAFRSAIMPDSNRQPQ